MELFVKVSMEAFVRSYVTEYSTFHSKHDLSDIRDIVLTKYAAVIASAPQRSTKLTLEAKYVYMEKLKRDAGQTIDLTPVLPDPKLLAKKVKKNDSSAGSKASLTDGKKSLSIKDLEEEIDITRDDFTNFCSVQRDEVQPWKFNWHPELDETFRPCEKPLEWKVIALKHHQKVAVQAMLDLEKNGSVEVSDQSIAGSPVRKILTSAGVCSNKFGSGKTMIILAMIQANPTPKIKPSMMQVGDIVVTRRFKTYLKPNLIIVGSSVLDQWESEIRRCTSLNVLVIRDVFKIRLLYQLVIQGYCHEGNTINDYDVIIVKNGLVTGAFNVPELCAELSSRAQRPLIACIADMSKHTTWSRVFLDDFDTINIDKDAYAINAGFTWFISATRKIPKSIRSFESYRKTYLEKVTPSQVVHPEISRYSYNEIFFNSELFYYFNIRTDSAFTEQSVQVAKPEFLLYKFRNPNLKFVQLIGAMGDVAAAQDILELLNGDAIETAADRAGIKSNSVGDIFQKLLGDQFELFRKATTVLDFISKAYEIDLDRLPQPPLDRETGMPTTYGKRKLYKVPDPEPILYNYGKTLWPLLKEAETETRARRDKVSVGIERVKNNIKLGNCGVCSLPFEGDDIFIMRCCSFIMCADCTVMSTNLKRNDQFVSGRCPQCTGKIGFNDLIFLNNDFDLDAFDNNTSEALVIKPAEKSESAVIDTFEDQDHMTKIDVTVQIIRGEVLFRNKKKANIHIPGLIEGVIDLPAAKPEELRTLVFADQEETLNNLTKRLTEENIKFQRLQGYPHEKAKTVEALRSGEISVILINGAKDCAGLNLQFASDLVFYKRLSENAVEAQVGGRMQRIGRTNKARFHYLLYDNEYHIEK